MYYLKKIGIVLAVLLLAYGGYQFYLWTSRPFTVENIKDRYPDSYSIEPATVSVKDEEAIRSLLEQKFSFLGQGHQTYAFLSQDGRYVIKFFNFTRLTLQEPIEWLPSFPFIKKYQDYAQKRRLKKFHRVFNGYKLAYEKDQDNTGVVYVHLQKTDHLNTMLNLMDTNGRTHTLSADDFLFVIQKKAEITRNVLTKLLDKSDLEGFKTRISQLREMYISEYQKGLFDSDHNIMSNTGFIEDRAYRIDVGRLNEREEMKNPEIYTKDFEKIFQKRILKWVKKNSPAFYEELRQGSKTSEFR